MPELLNGQVSGVNLYLNGTSGRLRPRPAGDLPARLLIKEDASVVGGFGTDDQKVARGAKSATGSATDSDLAGSIIKSGCRQSNSQQRRIRDGIVFIGIAREKSAGVSGQEGQWAVRVSQATKPFAWTPIISTLTLPILVPSS